MPPTLTFSLNAIDHPAFSPVSSTKSYIANLSPSLVTHTKDAATSHSVPRIPYKFFATREYDGVRSTPRATKDPKGVTARSINQATHPTAAAATLHRGLPPKTAAPSTDLPDLPGWALGVLVGALTFLLVVAVVLFVAQFPPRLVWLQKVQRKWQRGYTRLGQNDSRCNTTADHDIVGGRGESSAVAPSIRQLRSLKRRSRPTLSIDTGVGVSYDAAALGVVVPRHGGEMYEDHMHGEQTGLVEKKRRSYDVEALRMQPRSPIMPAWGSSTAPLPAAPMFTGGRRSQDVESRPYSLSAGAISTPDLFDFSAHHQQYEAKGDGEDDLLGSALLRRVNGGIYQAADKLSKAFYDQVTAPDEGLLLPVHEGEREKPLRAGVFVD